MSNSRKVVNGLTQCRLCSSKSLNSVVNLSGFPLAAQFFLADPLKSDSDIPVTLSVVHCLACGLVQLANPPVDYYRDVITAAALSPKSKEQLLDEWAPIISKYALQGKKCLEVGAGKGDFLPVLDSLNVAAEGIEHSTENIEACRVKLLNVKQGYLLEDRSVERYSLVVSNNYLEHQPETGLFLKKLVSLLSDEGILYLSVPNLDYLLEKSCLYEFVADHLVYFTQKTLRLACEINSLDVIEQYTKNNGNDLVVIAKKRIALNVSEDLVFVKEISDSLKCVVSQAKKKNKKIAVWGAGHRALALMAISDLSEIDVVVDSATFKQGKYTPLLHKKIISPDELLRSGCNLLIVMLPGNFAKQIESFIMDNKLDCEVIVFEDKKLTIDTDIILER
jgi:2-polyprenyl-3-methyl-5-hydroxy-6-metoxy-1,4-benzoquinol methylase